MNDMTNAPAALIAEGVAMRYPTRGEPLEILKGVDLSLNAGEAAAIRGPSGCGKTTLLNILGTLEKPTAGSVRIGGNDPFAMNANDVARFRNQHVGFIFQDHHLLPHCSTLENVLLPTLADAGSGDETERAKSLLERVGLGQRLDHRPAELSGGERQRTAIVRALINRPDLVLADEPTGNLDPKNADLVGSMLLELMQAESTALVVVTHSTALAERFERRYVLDDGRLLLG